MIVKVVRGNLASALRRICKPDAPWRFLENHNKMIPVVFVPVGNCRERYIVERVSSGTNAACLKTDGLSRMDQSGQRRAVSIGPRKLSKPRDGNSFSMMSRNHRESRWAAVTGVVLLNDWKTHRARF